MSRTNGKAEEAVLMRWNLQFQGLCLWCGPVLALGFGLGFVLLSRFVPPPAPTLSAQEVSLLYYEGANSVRAGMFVCILALTLIIPWGIGLALRVPSRSTNPALFYTQIGMIVSSSVASVVSCFLWALASFRAGQISPEIIMAINDAAWFMFLLSWPSFSAWFVLLGIGVLQDTRAVPGFPRWTSFLSFWVAFMLIPGGAIAFFKTGPFAWNGLFAFYLVVAAFFIWLTIMTFYAFRSLKVESHGCDLSIDRR